MEKIKKEPRVYKIDRERLAKMVEDRMFKGYVWYRDSMLNKTLLQRKLSDEEKRELRNCRANCYNELRDEKRNKSANFWCEKMTAGNLKNLLNRAGFTVRDGNVYCSDSGRAILKWYVDYAVLPLIEKEIGLTGIKLRKNVGPSGDKMFDFCDCHIVENKKEVKDEQTNNTNVS
jgi:predicted nucleic acid-binding Zn ribbon protein